MYTANFIANSDYLIKYLLEQHIKPSKDEPCLKRAGTETKQDDVDLRKDELDSRKLTYDIVDDAVKIKEIISEYPRIVAQSKNIGKFTLEEMLPMINNVSLTRRPVSVYRSDIFHPETKSDYINYAAVNYMIIGKPGNRTYKVAEQIEHEFNCVHIDCNQLVKREIQSKSRLGIWLDRNLQLNKILPIEIILWLVQRETMSTKIIYRGYILTGFPIIPHTNLNVETDFLTEDEFLMFLQIVDEIIDTPIKCRERELAKLKQKLFSEYSNLEVVDELKEDLTEETRTSEGFRPIPKLFHRISCERDVRFSIKRQLCFVLDLKYKPTLIIYLDCDDEDVITKNIILYNRAPDQLEGIRIALKRYNNALDIIQEFLCHVPRPNVIYYYDIYTPEEIFKNCRAKINELAIRKVYLADHFYETFKDDESIIEKLEAIPNPHEILNILCGINPVCEELGWFRSAFEVKCPVMTTKGKIALGKYQHSVRFTGLIYLLSSDENKRIFIENPQFYVSAFPTCRVAIMGPRCSGKSTFAKCLSKFFENSIVIDVNYLFNHYRTINVNSMYYAESCEHIISKLKSELLFKYNEEESIRQEKINDWIEVMKKTITSFLKPIPTKPGKTKKSPPIHDKKAIAHKGMLKKELNHFGFETNHPKLLQAYLTSKELFLKKLPLELRIKSIYREPQVTDTDVKKLISEYMNELSKDYSLPLARKLEILVSKIRLVEKRQTLLTKQKRLYGYWILDGLPPDTELLEGLKEMDCFPDVIVYIDDSVGERLSENQNIKCHREFYDINYVIRTVAQRNKLFFKHMINKYPLEKRRDTHRFESQLVYREIDHILLQEALDGTTDYKEENDMYREYFESIKSIMIPYETHLVQVDIHNKSWTEAILTGLKDYMNYFNAYPHVVENDWSDERIKSHKKQFRIGSTAEYCPVLFVDKMLLKLGLSQYSVLLRNRTYLLSSKEALQTFMKDPFRYSELERPFHIPPYRLCVIGNYHICKRNDLRRIAKVLGTKHLSIDNIINNNFKKTQTDQNLNITTYFEVLEYLGDRLVNDIVAPLFDEGFIFEDFPMTANQLLQMIKLEKYPEQIFYLKIENEHLLHEELKYYQKLYKDVCSKKINYFKLQNQDWMRKRKLRFIELFSNLPDRIDAEEEGDEEDYAERLEPDILNDILNAFDIVAELDREQQVKQLYVADMVNEEMPADQYTKLIDDFLKISVKQEVKHYVQSRLEEFKKIKSVAEEHLIPFIQIRLHPYTTNEVEKTLLKHVKESTDRQYIFERAHSISYENAVDYLHYGQFLLSRYYMNCPVKNVDMNYPVKLILDTPDINKKLQPFIFKENIYFVQREHHNVTKFNNRPYLYSSPIITCQVTTPIFLAINGPRNSGCYTLCNRISRQFQINYFTLDDMKKNVVKNFKWTKLGTQLIENDMKITDNQQICDLVKISTTFEAQGWILRDLPLNADLVECFILNGLTINLFIYLEPTGMDLWTNIKNKYNKEKYKRKLEVLQHLFGMISELENFSMHSTNFIGLSRNILTIKDFTSNWSTWNKAYREILLLLRLHNLYELRGNQIAAGSLYKLDVTDNELQYRLSSLKLYCPMCWIQKKLLVKYRYSYMDDETAEPLYSDNLYDKNLFQFRKYFYWSCNNHLVELMINAESYLASNEERVPIELPSLIKTWQKYMVLTNDGYCPVAYYESGGNNILSGLPEYSVLYYNKIYVMSSQTYCIQFLQNPDKYKDVDIIFVATENSSTVDEDLKNIKLDFGSITPTLITNALLECGFERPKHYNLEPGQSLEIYLGLYFKCHNTSSSNSSINSYKNLFLKYWDECKLVQRNITQMQLSGNPYILKIGRDRRASTVTSNLSSSGFGF